MITKTANEVAASLDGVGYPLRLCREDQELLRANGLVVVVGNSDDIISFYGAIDDEADVYEGGNVLIDKDGLLESEEQFLEGRPSVAKVDEYHKRTQEAREIKAKWCQEEIEESEVSWTYDASFRHETFRITDDGSVYCVGMVFHLDDLKPSLSQDDLKKHLVEHMREAEAMAYEYFKNCEVGEERVKAGLAYENIRNALKVG